LRTVVMLSASLALVLSVPVLAGAKPSAKPPAANDPLSLSATPDTVTFGGAATLTGKITGNDKVGKTVELEAKEFPYTGGFNTVATAVSDANGDFRFTVKPGKNTMYRATAKLSPTVTSGEVLVSVRIKVTLKLSDSTPRRGQRVKFSGSAYPAHDGRSVLIQRRRSDGTYKTVKSLTLTRVDGVTRSAFSARLRVYRDATYRAQVVSDGDHATGTSGRRKADVH
jgi:hypothetical protein